MQWVIDRMVALQCKINNQEVTYGSHRQKQQVSFYVSPAAFVAVLFYRFIYKKVHFYRKFNNMICTQAAIRSRYVDICHYLDIFCHII